MTMTNEKAIKWMEEAVQETTECFEQCSPSLQARVKERAYKTLKNLAKT